jgi:hypothetical protein
MMRGKPYTVHVVVDPLFGERLRELPVGEPVWIADTDVNRPAYETVGRERKPESHLVGLSSFKVDQASKPDDWLISELGTIDLHHGEYSHDPPWSRINVIGTKWTERIQKELERFGFTVHLDTRDGFEAAKGSANNVVEATAG